MQKMMDVERVFGMMKIMRDVDKMKVNREKIEVIDMQDVDDESDDLIYWLSRNPEERIAGIELMRQSFYRYDPISERLPRVFETSDET